MSRTIDFDAFRKEQASEPFHITIGGKQYDMPSAMPASLALDVVRLHGKKGDNADASVDDLMGIGAGLFGGEAAFSTILTEAKVTLDELPDLIRVVVEAYTAEVSEPPSPEAPTAG